MAKPICLACNSDDCAHLKRAAVLTPAEQRIIRTIMARPAEPLKTHAHELGIEVQTLRTALYRVYIKMGLEGPGCLRAVLKWAYENRDLLQSAAAIAAIILGSAADCGVANCSRN